MARNEAENATLAKVMKLPLGEGAARLLTQIKRAQALFKEIEAHYKRLLEREPAAIPGSILEPGALPGQQVCGLLHAVGPSVGEGLSRHGLNSCVCPNGN